MGNMKPPMRGTVVAVGAALLFVIVSSVWIMIDAAQDRDKVDACVVAQGPVLGVKEFCRAQVRQAR